ncbi:MAG: hypothetical protein AAF242_02290, partial [Bacteroidota bacterium]
MKNLIVFAIAFFIFGSTSLIAQCNNMLKNPAASQGLASWQQQGAVDAAGKVFRLIKPRAGLSQVVKIPKGSKDAFLSAWTKAGSKKTAFPYVYAEFLNQNRNVLGRIDLGVNRIPEWKQFANGASIPRGAVAIRVYMKRQEGSPDPKAIALLDNLCLSFDCKCKTPKPEKEEDKPGTSKDCCSRGANPSDFENLALNSSYPVGASFVSEGRQFSVHPFYDSNNQLVTAGAARVIQPNNGFSGKAIICGNTNIGFEFKGTVGCIRFKAANMGGNMNLEINGSKLNFSKASDINGQTLAGVRISASGGRNQAGMWY